VQHIAKCKHVCADIITFSLEDGIVHDLVYHGGDPCPGGSKAFGKLVEGQDARKMIELLSGNTCGGNDTSCADQFAQALVRALEAEADGHALQEGTV